jgi:hypothetical protein
VRGIGTEELGLAICPDASIFAQFDAYFMPWAPLDDAHRIVATLLNSGRMTTRMDKLASELEWTPRRINPAVTYLLNHYLVTGSDEVNVIYGTVQVWPREREDVAATSLSGAHRPCSYRVTGPTFQLVAGARDQVLGQARCASWRTNA